jgi:50S ribosomal subunit-associated GTPase HflX
VLKVFNKKDLVDPNLAALQGRIHRGVAVSALDPGTLPPLIARLEETVEEVVARRQAGSPVPAPFQDVAVE